MPRFVPTSGLKPEDVCFARSCVQKSYILVRLVPKKWPATIAQASWLSKEKVSPQMFKRWSTTELPETLWKTRIFLFGYEIDMPNMEMIPKKQLGNDSALTFNALDLEDQ